VASGEAAQGSRQLMLELIAECPARRCEIIVRQFSPNNLAYAAG
jgi:hypothetical protein